MARWLSDPLAPAWAQAIFAGLAIVIAVAVTAWQRSSARGDARVAQMLQNREHLRRTTVALRAEVAAALEAAYHQREGIEQTLRQVENARQQGIAVKASGPIRPGSMNVTDAIVYRGMASEIGLLPPELIKSVVDFYSRAGEAGRLADVAPDALQAYKMVPIYFTTLIYRWYSWPQFWRPSCPSPTTRSSTMRRRPANGLRPCFGPRVRFARIAV